MTQAHGAGAKPLARRQAQRYTQSMITLTNLEGLERHGFWYLASPYGGYAPNVKMAAKTRLAKACQIAAAATGYLISQQLAVFSPIAHSHIVAKTSGLDPLSMDIWLAADEPFMQAATGLLVLEIAGWQDSTGVNAEITHFASAQKPSFLLPWPKAKTWETMDHGQWGEALED
tara:strand:+ start:165 stop:683 length:519 start_codon:yes stop_codon:yes gene_type:complete